jgi:hypothetical protein
MTRPLHRRAPDGISPVVGYRVYEVDRRSGELFSLRERFRWIPRGRTEARCRGRHGSETIPYESCSCGLYAVKDLAALEQLEPFLWVVLPESSSKLELPRELENGPLVARVLLWGKVIEAEDGYRAQYGCVDEVLPRSWQVTLAAKVAKVYGVSASEELVSLLPAVLRGGPMEGFHMPFVAGSEPDVIPIRSAQFGRCWRTQMPGQDRTQQLQRLYRRAVPHLPEPEWKAVRLRFALENGEPWSYEDAAASVGLQPREVHELAKRAIAGLHEIEAQHTAECQLVFNYRRQAETEQWVFESREGDCPFASL